MTSAYHILLNNGKTIAVSSDLFEKLPEDSMLHNLLKADQEMAKKDEDGNYLLNLDHPDLFEFALQSIEKPDLNCYDLHSATRAFYPNFLDAMNAFVSTLDYLQFPIPEPYKAFMSDYSSFMPLKRAERIFELTRKQTCEMVLSIQQRMIQKSQILVRHSLQVAKARRMMKETLEMEIIVRLSVQVSCVNLSIDDTSDLRIAEKFEAARICDLEPDLNDAKYSPLYVLFKCGNMAAQAVLNEYFVPVLVDTFCKINSVKHVSSSGSLENTNYGTEKHLRIKLNVDLEE
ncbi:hypothetical protein MP638_005140 [Amoeboaphelidium occidentale]|nr:hypothetical protein MP638_005140 [Amoeboaphelidium occidentale]